MSYFLKWLATATTHPCTLFLLLFGKEYVKYREKTKDTVINVFIKNTAEQQRTVQQRVVAAC